MTFLRNTWYAAGWANEIETGKPVARTIIGDPVVLLRDASGKLSALADACPHRFAPLSLGRQDSDSITCSYHGLQFNMSGECIGNPHGPLLKSLCIRAYPLVEFQGMLWIWMGDPVKADTAKIPNVLGYTQGVSEHSYFIGYTHVEASHKLFEDNILDPTHADFLHPLLGTGAWYRCQRTVEERDQQLYLKLVSEPARAPIVMQRDLPRADMICDQMIEVWWHPSGAMLLQGDAIPIEQQDAGIIVYATHIYTPETEFTTHYFFSSGRNYKMDDEEYNKGFTYGVRMAFEHEDKPMIEGQQRRLGQSDLMDRSPQLFAMDSASIRARRMYDKLVATETTVEPSKAAA